MNETVLQSLNAGLIDAFSSDDRVHLLGEDILDPYGGAFKVTKGLSTQFPDRVISTPISEAGITGFAGGMALRGLLPVVEIMFGDFSTLTIDAVLNSISKFSWMYNDQVNVPVVIRLPMGGRRGYGPTHSQSIEKMMMGIPGIQVWAPTRWGKPGELLKSAILEENDPVIFIENKLQYLEILETTKTQDNFEIAIFFPNGKTCPIYRLRLKNAPTPNISLVAYGYSGTLAENAMLTLAFEEEIFCELWIPTLLSPFGKGNSVPGEIILSVQNTGKLLSIEEGTLTLGWGAEMLARISENLPGNNYLLRRIAAAESPVPASMEQEKFVLPQTETIVEIVKQMVKK